MSPAPAPQQSALVGRILVLSAVVMFALAMLFWNQTFAFFALSEDARPFVAGALVAAGLLDLGLGIVMMRRAR
jgi:hypothetical protein